VPARTGFACAFAFAAGCAFAQGAAAPAGLPAAIETARADAAKRVGIEAQAVQVVDAKSVSWSDGSLGCPQPDRMYTQALVAGFRVRLQAGGQALDYHMSARGGFVVCPPERSIDPVPGGRD
jgi:hypothetical protein